MGFEEFSKKVQEAGLKPKACSPYHWQILGGKFLVNYWPTRNKIHVGQTNHSVKGSYNTAIEYAVELPKGIEPSKRKQGGYKKYKLRLYRRSKLCAICKQPMTFEEASIDHIIPISRGGMNNPNNYQLTHKVCNYKKAWRV